MEEGPPVWPAISSVVYYVGIGVHALLAALIAQRLGLRARVPLAVSACYLLGMTFGAKALSDIREGTFDPAALLRREHFVAGGLWGGPAVYLALSVPVVVLMTRRRGDGVTRGHGDKETRGWRDGGTERRRDGGKEGRREAAKMLTPLGCETLDPASRRQGRAGFSRERGCEMGFSHRQSHQQSHQQLRQRSYWQSHQQLRQRWYGGDPLACARGSDWRGSLDLIALAAPIPIAIGKLPCLCAGCCHGRPTSLPWAITFPAGVRDDDAETRGGGDTGTRRQRDKGTRRQGDGSAKGQRDGGTEGQRDGGTAGRRDGETEGRWVGWVRCEGRK
jgi:hypothetical protein